MNKLTKKILYLLYDTIAIQVSFLLAFFVAFERNLFLNPEMANYLSIYLSIAIAVTIIMLLVLELNGMYSVLWEYASISEAIKIIGASIFCSIALISYTFLINQQLPKRIYLLILIFNTLLFSLPRLGIRYKRYSHDRKMRKSMNFKRVLIVGGGQAGSIVIKELLNHTNLQCKPVGIIDDDKLKQGKSISGVKVVGTREDIPKVVKSLKIDQIIICIPSASTHEVKEIFDVASQTDCEIKIVPGIIMQSGDTFDINSLRNVEVSDLLGREEISLCVDEMETYVKDNVILVTGGGGSIGSELCRQIIKFSPKRLIILDVYENNAFFLKNELNEMYPDIDVKITIASVRDEQRINEIFETERPFVVFHAAAHKHVPLMEGNPSEAIKNNVFGSYNVIKASRKYEVDRFVLISTDKAVNPTNVMGASKRITEILVQSQDNNSKTRFMAVRFGNVLGSNGSVIPIFKEQIAHGGPVKVTHKDIERYFMTIPEAAKLVLQASTFGRNNEIMVLDMGQPVKIVTLAESMIRLSGYKPYEDIDIVFTGLRPGEKMFEELILNDENTNKTVFDKIFIENPSSEPLPDIDEMLETLHKALDEDDEALKLAIKIYVPTYTG